MGEFTIPKESEIKLKSMVSNTGILIQSNSGATHKTCIVLQLNVAITNGIFAEEKACLLDQIAMDIVTATSVVLQLGNSPVTDGTFWGFFCPCKVSLEVINNFFPDILIYPKST